MQKPDLKTIEPYDVSFAEIRVDANWGETVQKVATAINVQFTVASEILPFVPFKQFENLYNRDKIFLLGPSGSGKSRTVIELLKGKSPQYEKIFVMNPSNPAGLNSGRENISTLLQRFGRNDLVIWDNFPEGLVKRDLENAFGALEIVNSSSVKNLYIALKPTYLEMYRGLTIGIPDLYTHEITCDLERMRALIKSYGKVEQYRNVFEKYVSANTDKIARILWQKQPLSLTVVGYYKALIEKVADGSAGTGDSVALEMAQAWLPVSDYFERQFEVMKNIPARKNNVEFLYTLRFCYEVGFDRTSALLASLQRTIFQSEMPSDPTRELGTWIFLSGKNYAMHDSVKNAVRLTDHARMQVVAYLADNFSNLVQKGEGDLHSLGLFIGKNIQFIANETHMSLLIPEQIYRSMKKNAVFERAIGRGIGENFELLEDSVQESILGLVDTELEFGVGLADSLGERLIELDDNNRQRLFEKIYHGMLFARYFGQSAGRLYSRLPDALRELVMLHAEKNPQFADGLGMGLGYMYATLEPQLQNEIMSRAQRNFETSRGLGFGFGLTFALLQEEESRRMLALSSKNSELAVGFGMGLAVSYAKLPDRLQKLVLERIAKDCEFAFGAGVYAAFFYKESCPPEIFGLLNKNTEISQGLGLGYGTGFFYLSENFQSKLGLLQRNNIKLDEGVGAGIGLVLKHLPKEVQEGLVAKASTNTAFATGMAYGLGYTWHYIGDEWRKRAIDIASLNSEFARGLGLGLGCHLDYLKPTYFEKIISVADANSELDKGLGASAAWAWPYYSEEARRTTIERMNTRIEFARGMGFGLARVIRHFSADEREGLLHRLSWDPAFSEGYGEGTGYYLWSTSDDHIKQDFRNQAIESGLISLGLGVGIGVLHSYFKNELRSNDPSYRKGMGIGIGKSYKYLSEQERKEVLDRAREDIEFAIGLGHGIGSIYNHLDKQENELVLSQLGDNGFTRGLGVGFGTVLSYLGDNSQDEILGLAANNRQLSLGLGAGLGIHISYLSEVLGTKIFDLAKNNSFLGAGLGEGCGLAFRHTSESIKNWLSAYVAIDGFAFGFGVGIGKIKRYLEHDAFERAAGFVNAAKFNEGFATGLGSVAGELGKEMLQEIFSRAGVEFSARNFGYGLGHVVSTIEKERRKEILELMKGDEEFVAGLGEGLGHYLPATGSGPIEEIMNKGSLHLAMGAAGGVAESFNHLNLVEVNGIIEYAGSRVEFARVLGQNLAEKFASLDQSKQTQILDYLQKDTTFSRSFVESISRNWQYLSAESREKMNSLAVKYATLELHLKKGRLLKMGEEQIKYAQFPVTGLSSELSTWDVRSGEISFSGRVQNLCVCFIDMIGSTKISSDLTPAQLSRYYELFLNAIAIIAKNFGARIVKNAGDALIFYFDDVNDPNNTLKFKRVLDCCLTMGMANSTLNAKMLNENLPPIKYRISADYGPVSVARSISSQNDDLFGTAMNISAKINSIAKPNGLVIGQNLFDIVKRLDEYRFSQSDLPLTYAQGVYAVYHVEEKEKRGIINPFERRPAN